MRTIWTHVTIDAPAEALWQVLTDTDRWHEWGPSVRCAELDEPEFAAGSTGTITTAVGAKLRFEITRFEPGIRWAWRVAGIPATDHRVEPLGPDRCQASFGVPWIAAPYLAVCQIALQRIKNTAEQDAAAKQGDTPQQGVSS